MLFWIEFSTYSSIDFLSETVAFRHNIKWVWKALIVVITNSPVKTPKMIQQQTHGMYQLKPPKWFNSKHMVCTYQKKSWLWLIESEKKKIVRH